MDGCPVKYALSILQGRWKFQILWELAHADQVRFNELQRRVEGISGLMLSKTLKELEADGLVSRRQFSEIPPRVEYSLSELGAELNEVLQGLGDWGQKAQAYARP
ncbi:MAG: winged helix-turn-helix transcriptional regulator [Coriobacteriia bacterium]